jgi:hypothetical protein
MTFRPALEYDPPMAGQISHIIAGEKALSRALAAKESDGDSAIDCLGEAAGFFRFGCQGPDIFFHNQRTMPSALHYGSLAHRRGCGSLVAGFAEALSPAERRIDNPAGAYLLGMATHAAVDRATHPFIVFFSGWAEPGDPDSAALRGCHPFLERILDMILLNRSRGEAASEYDIAASLSGPRGPEAQREADLRIASLWSAGLRSAYPRAAGNDSLLERRSANAVADARFFYAITNPRETSAYALRSVYAEDDPGRRRIALLYPAAVPDDLDAANERHAAWEDPSGEGVVSRASYLDLIEEGILEAARAVEAALDFFRTANAVALEAAVGNGCLSICNRSGDPVRPRISRPLPLPELMEAERRRRIAEARMRRQLT